MGAANELQGLSDEALLARLRDAADRLPAGFIVEIGARKERMVEPLLAFVRGADAWPALNALKLLGGLATPASRQALLELLPDIAARDADGALGVTLPLLLGAQGDALVAALEAILRNPDHDDAERALAAESLASAAARFADLRDNILARLRSSALDLSMPWEVRAAAGTALLDFARPGDRSAILTLARMGEVGDATAPFVPEEVAAAYEAGPDLMRLQRDGLTMESPIAYPPPVGTEAPPPGPWTSAEARRLLATFERGVDVAAMNERDAARNAARRAVEFLLLRRHAAAHQWSIADIRALFRRAIRERSGLSDLEREVLPRGTILLLIILKDLELIPRARGERMRLWIMNRRTRITEALA